MSNTPPLAAPDYLDYTLSNEKLVPEEPNVIKHGVLERTDSAGTEMSVNILSDKNIPDLLSMTVTFDDDATLPILTFRFWILSTFWVLGGTAVSTLQYLLPNGEGFPSSVVALGSYVMGLFMAWCLPTRQWTVIGHSFTMNPGHFNSKEHSLIVMCYWATLTVAPAIDILVSMDLYFGPTREESGRMASLGAVILLASSQLIGFGFVGIFRAVLIKPRALYYPGNLPNISFFNALHTEGGSSKKRQKFFFLIFGGIFLWQLFPTTIFPLLSALPWICWVGGGSFASYYLGSSKEFALGSLTLDWEIINKLQPLTIPFWSSMNFFAGAMIATWIVAPAIYFSNAFGTSHIIPPNSLEVAFKNGTEFIVYDYLTPEHLLNETLLGSDDLDVSTSLTLSYFWQFGAASSLIVFTALFYGPQIKRAILHPGHKSDDPYLALTKHSPPVSIWLYYSFVLLSLTGITLIGYLYEFKLPWWAVLLALAIAAIFVVPDGILFGISGQKIDVAIVSEIIGGYVIPGRPFANMTFRVFCSNAVTQALHLAGFFKFGYYMKIPERPMLISMLYGTALGLFVNWQVANSLVSEHRKDLTSTSVGGIWEARRERLFYSSSLVWGLLGSKRSLSSPQFRIIPYGLVLGATLPLILYTLSRIFKSRNLKWDLISIPIIFIGAMYCPAEPATGLTTSFIFSVLSMFWLRRYHERWFRKYDFLMDVALEGGANMAVIMVFLFISFPRVAIPHWWGNNAKDPDLCYLH
ncbi:Oligopeptide transporter 6 [Neolecta irregularis DAH-3]|uniref:Oligopeptide transporter 6 n=1 Tax=Neolecta irregularis (strain DAH-3) TaxID=1198029 RepID=A0A1U7LJ92_NEOID|nr:Oligopeptide transporter 6 [Neolecta irregularis DAH-3]|eukprot:OLL22717.1 Oligopeptide transporter 6 [Neolecta irregularis DAH-3]